MSFACPESPHIIPPKESSRFIVMSDCHRGNGTAGDEFAHNSLIYKCALEYYLEEGFTYIELGDAEELWENESFEQIYITHTSVYDLLGCFHDPDPAKTRYLKVWGNHDLDWRDDAGPLRALFRDIEIHEAIILQYGSQDKGRILLLHGHQADPVCSGFRARISRLLVRKLWSPLQLLGIGDPTRAAENPGRSNDVDKALYDFAKKESGNIPYSIIAGHTHRPVFENLSLTERRFMESGTGIPGISRKDKADSLYYNTGSCVHPRCITGIEITMEKPDIPEYRLVKWGYQAGYEVCDAKGCRSYPLAITRTVLEEERSGWLRVIDKNHTICPMNMLYIKIPVHKIFISTR